MRDVGDYTEHWQDFPPTHVAVRRVEEILLAAFGAEKKESDDGPLSSADEIQRFMREVNGGQ